MRQISLYEMFHNTLHVHMHSCTHNQNGVTAADVARVEGKEDILKVLSAARHQKATPTTDELSVNDDQTQTAQLPTEMQYPASRAHPPSPSAPPPAPTQSTHITTTPSSSQPTSPSARDTTSCDEPHTPTTATCKQLTESTAEQTSTTHRTSPQPSKTSTTHRTSPQPSKTSTTHRTSPQPSKTSTADQRSNQAPTLEVINGVAS